MLDINNQERLLRFARRFTDFNDFIEAVGIEDWMQDYFQSDIPTESELNKVSDMLENIFDAAHDKEVI